MAFLESLSFGKGTRGNGEKRRIIGIIGTNFVCKTAVVTHQQEPQMKIKIFAVLNSNQK